MYSVRYVSGKGSIIQNTLSISEYLYLKHWILTFLLDSAIIFLKKIYNLPLWSEPKAQLFHTLHKIENARDQS